MQIATVFRLFIATILVGLIIVTGGAALADGGDTPLQVALWLLQNDTKIVFQSMAGQILEAIPALIRAIFYNTDSGGKVLILIVLAIIAWLLWNRR